MHNYNNHFPTDATPESLTLERAQMLEGILGKAGSEIFIEPPFSIDYGCNISIGAQFYSNFKYVFAIIRESQLAGDAMTN